MNNFNAASIITPRTEAQQACVDLLQETLTEALAGRINSVAIIAVMKTGYATVLAGTDAADINLGADLLKRRVLETLETDRRSTPQSRIVSARAQ